MTFRNAFNFQDAGSTSGVGFDGMVLEISINGAAFQDIIASGGSFVTGGYNKTISGATGSPIANRMAWSGLSGATTAVPAYITTTVNLPPAANGQLVRIRWLVASDSGTVAAGDQGARIDTIIGTACGATAAAAAISGRVMTADGMGIRNARVVITGNALSEPRVATTGSFGWFNIDGLQTGETYVVTVNSQRYTFSTPSRVISLVDNVVDADFIANPQE